MIDRSAVLYPVIYLDHDGTWTWSVESGKAFEAEHRVYDRDTGYATKGDAREAALARMAQILREGQSKT